MIDLSKFITIDKPSTQPVYLQIVNHIISLIKSGVLLPGVKIQPSRDLSKMLNVHRNTVVASYNELHAQGWITVRARKGCFISPTLPDLNPVLLKPDQEKRASYPGHTSFAIDYKLKNELLQQYPSGVSKYVFNEGFPDVRLTPLKELLREYQVIGNRKSARKHLSYSTKEGSLRLREELVKMLRQSRGLNIETDNILITKGAQMAIYLTASLLLKPGDHVIVGEPSYFIVNAMLDRLGARICRVPVDEHGIDVDAVARLCESTPIRMIYVIPHHHHPTTVTLSADRRLKLLDIAAQYKIAVIEDDFDFDIHYENRPTLPMASSDQHGSVIYIGTLTKIFAPTIRLGYVVAPQNFIRLIGQHRVMVDLQGDNLLEEAMAELFVNGAIERHLKKIRSLYKERRDLLCKMLSEQLPGIANFTIPQGGLCLWVTFKGVDTKAISKEALRNGLFIRDGKNHNPPDKDLNAMCIGFASMNPEELREAGQILIDAVLSCMDKG
ncbi:MocR-like pyridoxine biosynthesis transcription factor PdxR [Dyadobacter diqingensis]|uniref:MocR-like pyridoxine biosynthesis transcription factor PdxR n=1 Tax=Dyadobacter diqingensis TaxID=2938121 RepID=UPI0020C2469C|nr:PLP-dependent aminotransferase family protein [Dyadobacter diqingensis]